jgi:tetratricopeptide (TPR) repeat protein
MQNEHVGVEDDYVHFFAHVARVAWSAGDTDTMTWLVRQVDEAGDAIPLGLRAHRLHVAGLVADRAGDAEAAEPAYLEAIALFRQWGAHPAEARAHADLGVLLTRLGRSEEAAPHLAQAHEVFTRLGAAAWQAELDEALTGVGVR